MEDRMEGWIDGLFVRWVGVLVVVWNIGWGIDGSMD